MSRRERRLRQRRRSQPKQQVAHPTRTLVAVLAVPTLLVVFGWAWWRNEAPRGPVLPDPPSWLPSCPIGGGPVNFAHRVTTTDGPVFLCCHHCMDRYRSDPAAFTAQVKAQRKSVASLDRVQVTCPVLGDPIDPTVTSDSTSGRITFCSNPCADAYEKNPRDFAEEFANSFWYQTKCPVDQQQISAAVSITLATSEKFYLCSVECREEFARDPGRYAAQLAQQGVRLHLN